MRNKTWHLLYWLNASVQLLAVIAITLGDQHLILLDYISKPLLMPLLMILFYQSASHITARDKNLMLVALFFSFIGDTALMFAAMPMFKSQQILLFLSGVGAFLLTHVCYITYFYCEYKKGGMPSLLRKAPYMALPTISLAGLLLYIIVPTLPTVLKPAIVIYASVLTTMVLMAINRFQQVSYNSFYWCCAGAFLFMFSDGVIALTHFYVPFQWGGAVIMFTYITGQYFIVQGALTAVDYSTNP